MGIQRIVFIVSAILFAEISFAQKTAIYNSPDQIYRQAGVYFEKELYSAAFDRYFKVTELTADKESLMYGSSVYYMAVCAYHLLNYDAEYRLQRFIEDFPENAYTGKAQFFLANIQYREKRYQKAFDKYQETDPGLLSGKETDEYFFKYGYSAFMIKDYETARSCFSKVKDGESLFSAPATYYFGHIAYEEKNYSTALEHFKKLTEDENFGPIVPYYITQILYFQKKYTELINFAEPMMMSATTKRLPEIAQLLGEAYFNTADFKKAAQYFEVYKEKTAGTISPEDNYKLGYAYYRQNDFTRAIPAFQNATSGNDSLAQSAHYHLGDCYLKVNNKPYARSAFYQAYKLGSNPMIAEDALFHFAKLSYELGINPYNEAIRALMEYILAYPDNFRVDEAYEYLINLYMQTKNYKEAIVSIEKIKRPNEKLNMAYQKIAYFRGVELFNDRNYRDAIGTFNKSLKFPYDKHFRSQSLFWKGEAYYRLQDLDSAIITYNSFLQSPGSFGTEYYALAYYNIGYCYFNKKEYDKALTSFRTFQEKYTKTADAVAFDAYIRTGDCYYAQKRFADAEKEYNKSVQPGVAYVDYALFQRGNSKGVQGNFRGKIEDLELLIKSYPNSSYMADVLYELAFAYELTEQYQDAIRYHRQVVDNHNNSTYHVRSMKQIGMIYYNQDQSQQALAELKKVIQAYPGTDEAKEALVVIRNIYTELGQPEAFFIYAQELGTSVGISEQDSISYVAAENIYFKGDFPSASVSFEKYLQNFPNGAFVLNANFYKAECDYSAQKFDKALPGYEFVISRPWNKFTEKSLLNAARIYYSKENYTKSAAYFASLEEKAEFQENILIAREGMMRSYFKDKQYRQAIIAAQKVIDTPKANEESTSEAKSIMGVSAYEVEDYAKAQQVFEEQKILKSEYGAEAYYYLALINYTIGKHQESEKLIFELINTLPSYEYWIAKAFILLSDNYVATGNLYQAKHTLQSVIDNYQGVDLVMEAQKKMEEIKELESQSIPDTEE
jgi:TolA-binding protein